MLYDVEVFVLNDPEVMERIAEALERIADAIEKWVGWQ